MKVSCALIALFIAGVVPVSAQRHADETLRAAARPEGAPATVGELLARLPRAAARASGGPRASVISADSTADSFVIPVAGNAAGGGGTFFKSDVVFDNDRLAEQRIAIGWMAQGQNNCGAPVEYFTLSANSVTVADDFVNRTLGKTGLGAVLVVAVTATGVHDANGEIDGYSRIWTPQPGSAGTVSQNFSAISLQDSLGSTPATLMGLKQSTQFRANVGVVNLDTAASHTWTFTSIFNGRTTTLSVPPCSMVQTAATAGSASATGNAAFTVRTDASGFYWSGFGSSTDNVTGDGWVSRAIQ